ncbi:persulfide dioxygenase ETHE1, mitochondrial [Patella vulgata]|uniref:persulfide dioxygenase ETHE1, mitochondrial n=1 Tax=Patella vulgata TaxID=6465 RepID=UPI0024A9D458|nr:persulfide dioxygenase ETHE1, mitochondrial [Patella vulgata]
MPLLQNTLFGTVLGKVFASGTLGTRQQLCHDCSHCLRRRSAVTLSLSTPSPSNNKSSRSDGAIRSLQKRRISSDTFRMNIGGEKDFIFKQLLDYKSYTYTYLLGDCLTREAVLIDPVIEMADRDIQVIKDLGLNLKYAVNTHVHADHITGSGVLKKRLKDCKSMIADVSQAKADIKLNEGDLIKFGGHELEVRSTPGHTDGCLSYVWHNKMVVFTGDAVLIRGCGRTDFQQGDAGRLYDSVHNKIFILPKDYVIYPAHDYTGQTSSTVGEEVRYNSRLGKTREEFIKLMKELNLPYPKQIDKALPANMVCGIFDEEEQKN